MDSTCGDTPMPHENQDSRSNSDHDRSRKETATGLWSNIVDVWRLFCCRCQRGDLEGASMALWPASWQRTLANSKWMMKALRWCLNLQMMFVGALCLIFSPRLYFKQKLALMRRYFACPHMVLHDRVYSEHAPTHTRLDLYAPLARDAPPVETMRPVLVFVHGGVYTLCNKETFRLLGERLAMEGCVCVVASYRYYPDTDTAGQVRDVSALVQWVTQHASRYGGDTSRIFLMGQSSGAHVVSLYMLQQPPPPVRGFVLISGLYDPDSHRAFEANRGVADISPLTPVNGGRAGLSAGTYNSVNLARSRRNDTEGAAKAQSEHQSPPLPGHTAAGAFPESEHTSKGAATTDRSTLAPRSEPPAPPPPSRQSDPDVLLIHGEDDCTVPQCQSETMQAALGRRAKLCVLPGVDHSAYFFTMMAGGQSRVLDCVLRFCKKVESRDPEP